MTQDRRRSAAQGPHGGSRMRSLATLAGMLCLAGSAGCGAPPPAPHTVSELADDPLLLQGIMERCAADSRAAASDIECVNARLAIERTAAQEDAKKNDDRGADFERQREQRRLQEEQRRRAAERAQPGFDPYSSPVTIDKPPDTTKP